MLKFLITFLLIALATAAVALAIQVGGASAPIKTYDGNWWLLLSSEEQSGFINGHADCYQFELNEKLANPKPAVQTRELVTDFYCDNSSKRSTPVIEVIRVTDLQRRAGKTLQGGEVWTERHGYWDGQWWREATATERLGFVEGYLACFAQTGKHAGGGFSKPTSEYVSEINGWYKLDVVNGNVDAKRIDAKIADVLVKFQDQLGH
jgi:hypothetical protein